MKTRNFFALSAISLALIGCGGDNTEENQPGSLSLSGTAKEGETLTATLSDPDGVQDGSAVYTWFANGNVIAGETSSTLTLGVDQAGTQVNVAVLYIDNANNREGFATPPTAEIEALPVNSPGVLTITGSATVEQTLTLDLTDGNGVSSTVTYSWAADGTTIDGETSDSLELTQSLEGAVITATASYTDDEQFVETVTSAPTEMVAPVPENNVPGTLNDPIIGALEIGGTLTAPTPVDANGISNTITYQWQTKTAGADDSTLVDISGATSATYTVVEADLGNELSVNVSYQDDAGFDEALTQGADDQIFSFYVTGEAALTNALANVAENGSIGIASAASGEDYTDMADMVIATDGITIKLVNNSTAVISGTTCFDFNSSVTGVTMDGLIFDGIIIPNAGGCGEGRGSIELNGSANVLKNNQFLSDTWEVRNGLGSGDESHYISVSGLDNVIERNLFEGKSVNEGEEGSIISVFVNKGADVNSSEGTSDRTIIQYNLFRNITPTLINGDELDTDSGSHAVQIGRSGNDDGSGVGSHVVQYNRFDTALYDRGLIIVQGGGNTINGNTIVNSWGNVELRNGYANTVSNNIIIAKGGDFEATIDNVVGSNNKDGGIAFTPLGHTITNNYVANTASNSSDRAALHIDSDHIDSGNSSTAAIIAAGLDLSVTIANNTFLNNRNAIQFEDDSNRDSTENCTNLDYVLDFDDNLFANQSSDNNIFGTSTGGDNALIKQDEYPDHGCALDNASDYDNNHFYGASISDSTPIMAKRDNTSLVDGADSNVLVDGTVDGASLTAPDANLLVEGTGDDAGVGADISSLIFIEEHMVGPGSTWTAPAPTQ